MSLTSLGWGVQVPLATSENTYLLTQDMKRYIRGEISGRSFLISGHRGGGKTTLVSSAFLDVWREHRSSTVRPLLVWLHGPNLLTMPDGGDVAAPPLPTPEAEKPAQGTPLVTIVNPPPVAAANAAANGAVAAPGKAQQAPAAQQPAQAEPMSTSRQRVTDAQRALIEMTLQLHRAVTREFTTMFRQYAQGEHGQQFTAWQNLELLELAAQLEIELFDRSNGSRLRELWRRAGALRSGVLFGEARSADQGLREVVALMSVIEAYRRVSGTFTRQETTKRLDDATLTSTTTVQAAKDAFMPFLSVLTGGLAAVGVYAVSENFAIATIGSMIAAIASAVSLRVDRTRTQQRTSSEDRTFVFDTSVATLDRMLPVIIDRVTAAGLVPIFVADELDKVDDLQERILGLVHHLKKLVAERAFFCFLTDRDYFDHVSRGGDTGYSKEHTYFTHQLFVVFSPETLRRFILESILVKPRDDDPTISSDDAADYQVLPWVLLHRSRMHPIDLRREIAARTRDEALTIRPGAVRTDVTYWLDVLMQVAVEIVLDDEDLQRRLLREPAYRRLAHDALYYLTRNWEAGATVDLGDAGRPLFAAYLQKRSGNGHDNGSAIQAHEVDFLLQKVELLASLLSSHEFFQAKFKAWEQERRGDRLRELPPELAEVVTYNAHTQMPLEWKKGTKQFKWQYDKTGPLPASPEEALEEWPDSAGLIEDIGRHLKEILS